MSFRKNSRCIPSAVRHYVRIWKGGGARVKMDILDVCKGKVYLLIL